MTLEKCIDYEIFAMIVFYNHKLIYDHKLFIQNYYYHSVFLEFFDNIIMFRFGNTKVAKKELDGENKPIKDWDVDVDKIRVSDLFKQNNSKYLMKYLDNVIRLLFLIIPKMSGHAKTS